MNVEFHYYAIYYLAREAGFAEEECRVIAYSSQYLDNALVSYRIETPDGTYSTLVTHHFGFWDDGQEWDVWLPFHFFPAGAETPGPPRRDARRNPLNVAPDSARAKALLVDALRTRDLYRVGIALHTYADAWAHQGFTGRVEDWNRLDPSSPLPPVGHAQALRDPDDVDACWQDPRLLPPHDHVDNRTRFLAAARRVYRYLSTYNRRPFADELLVVGKLDEILGRSGAGDEERVADFVIACGMEQYSRQDWRREAFEPVGGWASVRDELSLESTVDKLNWLRNELLRRSRVIRTQAARSLGDLRRSHLYRWDQAARAHRDAALRLLADLRTGRRAAAP